MSVSLYAYESWNCCGDCDRCYKKDIIQEDIEQDGFITPERYLKNDN